MPVRTKAAVPAPWLPPERNPSTVNQEKDPPTIYETIWRELVDLELFIAATEQKPQKLESPEPDNVVQSQNATNGGKHDFI